ncbi:unnamed protein product [Schistosoma mattheei]|uniref:Uncharacterized protein n=1 Tax=Schistosoma mattheei TaxID=31246 RepID=A0A183PEF8_9TREM|nr:unnamed protein product [Schistosoma mattheei]
MMITKDGDLSEILVGCFPSTVAKRQQLVVITALLMDPVIIKKGAALRLLRHLKPDKSSGLDNIHPGILIAPADSIGR